MNGKWREITVTKETEKENIVIWASFHVNSSLHLGGGYTTHIHTSQTHTNTYTQYMDKETRHVLKFLLENCNHFNSDLTGFNYTTQVMPHHTVW